MYSFWDVNVAMLEGSVTTLQMFVLTLLFALPLGLIISFGSMSRFSPLRWLTKTFVWIIRGSPLMLQILIVFYGPGLLFGWKALPRFTAALVTFVINYACYFSEIYRGGIQGVPKGQQEAGQVLGMTKSQIFFKVTLLQVVKRIVPPMGNEFITLVKDTSLVRVISVYDHLGGRVLHQEGHDLAPLLLHGVLLTVQRRAHPGPGVVRAEAELLQIRRRRNVYFTGPTH